MISKVRSPCLRALAYGKLFLQVFLFFLFLLGCHYASLFFDGTHDFLEPCFPWVGSRDEIIRISASVNKGFTRCVLFGFVQFVKSLF